MRSRIALRSYLSLVVLLVAGCGGKVNPVAGDDAGAPGPDAGGDVSCALSTCGAACVDLARDVHHCGACDVDCGDGPGLVCNAGRCDAACDSPTTRCPPIKVHPAPYCSDLLTDPSNCGACGYRCSDRANATTRCDVARCALTCDKGFADCDGSLATGCESQLASDASNCGGCGNACLPGAKCVAGSCSGGGCTPPSRVCSGVCTDVMRDPANCGDCGKVCSAGLPCVAGSCSTTTPCSPPLRACAGACVDVSRDLANCGDCGRACKPGDTCSSGACVAAPACPPPEVSCSGTCVDLGGDVASCGSCGHACAPGELCGGGTCSCLSPHTRCGARCVDTSTDSANCGSCGTLCAAGTACSASSCVAAGVCSGGAASVLFYGPTGSVEAPFVSSPTIKVATEAEWRAMTTADFASYSLIVIGESALPIGPSQLQAAYDTRATWSVAVTGRIAVLGIVPGTKAADGIAGAQGFLKAAMTWLTTGPTGTTALYVASDWGTRNLDYLSSFGLFGESTANGDDVRVGATTHPMMAASTDATLSGWHSSVRTLFSTFPSGFVPLAKGLGGPAGSTPPPASGLVVLAKDAACTP